MTKPITPKWEMHGGVVFMDYSIYCGKDHDTEERFWGVRIPNDWREQRFDNVQGAIGVVLTYHRDMQRRGYPPADLDHRTPPPEPA